MTITVMMARVRIRVLALSKLSSVTSSNCPAVARSLVKACTACAERSASDALPELSAIQSWFWRLSIRKRRPRRTIGTMTTGTISSTRPVSLGEV